MEENVSAVIDVQYQYAFSKDGNKRVPIGITVSEGDELLFSSAIYASEKIYNILRSGKTQPDTDGIDDTIEVSPFGTHTT